MKEAIVVNAQERTRSGSNASGGLRRQGTIPAVVYGEGKPTAAIQLNERDFNAMLHRHASEHMILDLVVDGGAPRKVLLKEVQHHVLTGRLLHVDFNEVSMTRRLRVEVPIELVGDPVGVTQQGGSLDHLLRKVEIECLPDDLIEQVEVDVTNLALGQHLNVKDLPLDPAKYRVVTSGEIAIASVSVPRVEEVAAPAEGEAAAAATAEPEVLKAKKPEEAAPAAKGSK